MSKIEGMDYSKSIRLRIISESQIDEDRFRSAVANWICAERERFNQQAKILGVYLIELLAVASLFIVLSIYLSQQYSVISYTIIPEVTF